MAVHAPQSPRRGRVRPILRSAALLLFASAVLLGTPSRVHAEDWQKLDPAELASRSCPFDTSAGAEILFRKVDIEHTLTDDGLIAHRDYYVRIKVYTEAAAQEQALVRITASERGGRISDVRGRTVLPDGSAIPLPSKSVTEDLVARGRSLKVRRTSFAMPGVKPGCILEYRFREVDESWYEEFTLQHELPARLLEYRLRPLRAEGARLQMTTFLTDATLGGRDPEGYYPVRAQKVRAFTTEPHMPPARQLQPRLLTYYTTEVKPMPAAYWRAQSKELARDFDTWTKPNNELRALSQQLTAGGGSELDRLRAIAEWCRREIRVRRSNHPDSVKAYSKRTNYDARETLRRREGSSRDLDRLFGALARAAGFDVRMLRMAVRGGLPFDQECVEVGMLTSFEIAVRVNGRWECFDPQGIALPWNMVPDDEEGQMALFCDPDSAMFLQVSIAPPRASTRSRTGSLVVDAEGGVTGDVRVELSGHWNARLRDELEDAADSVQVFRETMDWEGDWLTLEGVHFEPGAQPSDPMVVRAHVQMPAHAALAGNRLLLEPSLWWAHREPLLTGSKRRWPVLFDFAWTDHDSLTIRVPEGFQVSALEAPRPVVADGVSDFRVSMIESSPGVLSYVRTFELGQGGTLLFASDTFPELRKLFELVHDRDRATITLQPTAAR